MPVFDITNFITIAGAIAGIVGSFAGIATYLRTPKLPEPPITPSCVIFTGIEMQRPEDLPGHSRPSRDRLL